MNDSKSQGNQLVFCGCHEGGIKAFEGLINSGFYFSAIVCLSPEQGQRYQVSGYHDYRPLAQKHNIPMYIPKTYALTAEEDLAFFQNGNFDILIQGGWQRLFPCQVLSALKTGALGLHGSADLLPKGRGRSPMNWALIEGRKRFLMHLFLIKPGVDDGDVIGIQDFDITPFDDIETLYFKYAIVYRDLLLKHLPSVQKKSFALLPQNGTPSYYPKREPKDGRIDWEEMDIWQIYNFVRAQTRPYSGAFGKLNGRDVRIWRCRPFETRMWDNQSKYGKILETFGKKLIINCRGGFLCIDEWEEI